MYLVGSSWYHHLPASNCKYPLATPKDCITTVVYFVICLRTPPMLFPLLWRVDTEGARAVDHSPTALFDMGSEDLSASTRSYCAVRTEYAPYRLVGVGDHPCVSIHVGTMRPE